MFEIFYNTWQYLTIHYSIIHDTKNSILIVSSPVLHPWVCVFKTLCISHYVYKFAFPHLPTQYTDCQPQRITYWIYYVCKFNNLPIVLHRNISSITRVDTAPSRTLSKLNTYCVLWQIDLCPPTVKINLERSTVLAYV